MGMAGQPGANGLKGQSDSGVMQPGVSASAAFGGQAAMYAQLLQSQAQAEAMAEQQFGQLENTATQFGFEGGATEANQMLSPRAVENRRRVTDQARARARTNEAMSNLGPKGSMTQRLFDAIQKQGDDPDEAGIDKLMFDMLGVEDLDAKEKLVPELQEINKQKEELESLEREIASEDTTAKRRQELREEIDRRAIADHNKISPK